MDTSRKSYGELIADGSLVTQQLAVFRFVQAFPKRTSKELADKMKSDRVIPARRLSELEQQGLVVRDDKRKCSLGNRLAYTWVATA
jgi:DNA-binding MarR family transcriptional regulator